MSPRETDAAGCNGKLFRLAVSRMR